MKYFKIIFRTGEEDFETKEIIINEDQHKEIQNQIIDGSDFVVVRNKATIKRTSIASISEANDIVAEYQKEGVKIDGILDAPELPKLSGEVRQPKTAQQIIKDTHFDLYKKHGWAHGDSCICKSW